jgi:hypothetical protein
LLGITSHAFRKRMGGMQLKPRDLHGDPSSPPPTGDTRQDTLLALICSYPEARTEIVSFGAEKLFDGPYLELAQLMLEALADNDDIQCLSHLTEKIEQPEQRSILSRLLVSDGYMADINWREVFNNCQHGREKVALRYIKDIAARLAVLEPDSEEYAELLQQADALRTRKSKL